MVIRAKGDISQFDPLANDPIVGIIGAALDRLKVIYSGSFLPGLGDEQ